jgi:hypothetical protein
MNPKVISRMRQEGRFPIPHKTVGARKIIYPLGVVVDYLLESPPSQGDVTRRKPSGKRASLPDLSRQMLLRGFLEAVSNQMQLLTGIEITLQRQLAYEDLDTTVPNASSTRSAPRQGKI